MEIKFHPHALERITERGTTEDEVIETINKGEEFPAKYGRIGFSHNFPFNDMWHDKFYVNKQLEVYAVKQDNDWLVITIITKYF